MKDHLQMVGTMMDLQAPMGLTEGGKNGNLIPQGPNIADRPCRALDDHVTTQTTMMGGEVVATAVEAAHHGGAILRIQVRLHAVKGREEDVRTVM